MFEFFVFCVLYVGQGVYDFRPCDKIVDWAIDRGMEVKGHTLCWHVTTPEFAEDMSASRLREALYRRDRETERQRGRHTDRRIDAQYGTRSYGRHEGGTKYERGALSPGQEDPETTARDIHTQREG